MDRCRVRENLRNLAHSTAFWWGRWRGSACRLLGRLSWRSAVRKKIRQHGVLKLHLGCGDRSYPDMLNCEFRRTEAADLCMDCADLRRFANRSVALIFSHAFFEHLEKSKHQAFIGECRRILQQDGPLVFLGVPDFRVIAESYLRKAPGIRGKTFDLYNAYRYTHGDPEGVGRGYWYQQLHKYLFDRDYFRHLLQQGGFRHAAFFNYCYPGESIPLNLGVVAWTGEQGLPDIREILEGFSDYIDNFPEAISNVSFESLATSE